MVTSSWAQTSLALFNLGQSLFGDQAEIDDYILSSYALTSPGRRDRKREPGCNPSRGNGPEDQNAQEPAHRLCQYAESAGAMAIERAEKPLSIKGLP
jgi:hypothetical protein